MSSTFLNGRSFGEQGFSGTSAKRQARFNVGAGHFSRVSELITCLVADDHPPARAGVRASLEGHGFIVIGEEADGPSAVEAAGRLQPHVCVLDVYMPGGGIAAAAHIHDAWPSIAVVMLTIADDDNHLFAALRAGASGYLLKDIDPERLPAALRGVLNGEAALPRALAARLVAEYQHSKRHRSPLRGRMAGVSLTDREWDVFEALRAGQSTSEAAASLGMAPVTVRTHVAAVVRKLDVPDRETALRLLDAC